MKKTKTFNVGDKVFAKVKGYPAWPAKIVGENGKKYDVTFYGTSETGSIKVEDLFYYLKYKEQFCKNLKRKDYIDAIEQIEAEIKKTGTDGNENKDVTISTTDATDKKGKKRKRSESLDKSHNEETTSAPKKSGGRNSVPNVSSDTPQPHESDVTNEDTNTSQKAEVKETGKITDVTSTTTLPTSRSGRVIKVKRFSDSEGDTPKRRKSTARPDVLEKLEVESKETKTPKRRKSVSSHEAKDTSNEQSVDKKERKTPNRRKSVAVIDAEIEPVKEPVKEPLKEPVKEDVKCNSEQSEQTAVKDVKHLEKDTIKEENDENKENKELENKVVAENQGNSIKAENIEEIEPLNVNVVSIDHLNAVIAYADYVRSKKSEFKKKPVEEREKLENEVVIAKLSSGKLVGIKYNTHSSSKCDTEYEEAESDELEAKTILSLKDLVEKGDCKPEDDPNMFIMNIKLNEAEIQERNQHKVIERKKSKLKWLKIEANLVDIDSNIKCCLGLDKAEPKKALEYMESMMELNVDPLMLKKHPHIVDVVKRLRRYVGNIKEWNLTGDSLETFEADAEQIRLKAEEVFVKFKSLFKIPPDTTFWDAYNTEVEQFKNDTNDLKECEIFALCADPISRRAFFNLYDDKQELEKIENEESEKKFQKEDQSESAVKLEQPENKDDTIE